MDRQLPIRTPLEHPCYAGHFPGNPIVPGVLLLELIVMALERGAPRSVGSVKFHRAVKPGDAFTLQYQVAGARAIFRGVHDGQLLIEGNLTFDSPTTGGGA